MSRRLKVIHPRFGVEGLSSCRVSVGGSGVVEAAPAGLSVVGLALLLIAVLSVGVVGYVAWGYGVVRDQSVVRVGSGSRSTLDATSAVPVSLAAAASGVIGAQAEGFRVVRRAGVLSATGGGVSSSFTRRGVRVATVHGAAGLSLAGVGYGRRLTGVRDVAPVAAANLVSYTRGWLREWYRTGPFGLEQGFTLARRPPGRELGALTLALRLRGSLHARRSGSMLVFAAPDGEPVFRYIALSVRDATGRSLPALMVPTASGLELRVWDRDARYPLKVDPTITPPPPSQLFAPNAGADAEVGHATFGYSVAISADGDTALIGAPRDNGGAGAAWVFTLSGSTWSEQQKLTAPTTGAGAEIGNGAFGYSVALSPPLALGTAQTAVIGAPDDNGNVGAAWVFTLWAAPGASSRS